MVYIYIYIYADVSDIKRRDMNNTHMVRLEREKLEREGKWEQGWGERGIRTVVVVPELDACDYARTWTGAFLSMRSTIKA